MHYYNGLSAAKRIGISYKTLLRYIEKRRIIPEEGKTPTGQLVISEDQVEALRLEIQRERAMFRHPQTNTSSNRQTETDRDSLPLTDTTLTEAVKHIGKLAARVDVQQARVEELERRVAELESLQSQNKPFIYVDDTSDVHPQQSPAIANVEAKRGTSIPADLPDGTLHSKEFGAQLGFTNPRFEGMLKNGVRGEQLERERIPTAIEGRYTNYFTPEQQEKAIALLKRHGKL